MQQSANTARGVRDTFTNKRFKCEQCEYGTFTKREMSIYINSIHLNLKLFKCNECDFTESKKYKLVTHKFCLFEIGPLRVFNFAKIEIQSHINSTHLKIEIYKFEQ